MCAPQILLPAVISKLNNELDFFSFFLPTKINSTQKPKVLCCPVGRKNNTKTLWISSWLHNYQPHIRLPNWLVHLVCEATQRKCVFHSLFLLFSVAYTPHPPSSVRAKNIHLHAFAPFLKEQNKKRNLKGTLQIPAQLPFIMETTHTRTHNSHKTKNL